MRVDPRQIEAQAKFAHLNIQCIRAGKEPHARIRGDLCCGPFRGRCAIPAIPTCILAICGQSTRTPRDVHRRGSGCGRGCRGGSWGSSDITTDAAEPRAALARVRRTTSGQCHQ